MISPKIIKIASYTKNSGLNNDFTHKTSVKNSLCGDKIKIELIANDKMVNSMRYETESCVLCEASASLVAKKIRNYPLKSLKKDIAKLKESIKKNESIYPSKFKEYRYFLTKDSNSRFKCVTLPLEGLLKAFKL